MNCLNSTIIFCLFWVFFFSVQKKNLIYEHSFPIKNRLALAYQCLYQNSYICSSVIRANMSMNGNAGVFKIQEKSVCIKYKRVAEKYAICIEM